MVIRIQTLVEDTVEKPDLIGEHGLSILISAPVCFRGSACLNANFSMRWQFAQ